MEDSPTALPLLSESQPAEPLPRAVRLSRWFALIQVGLIWVIPAGLIIQWMQKPDRR